MFSDSYQSSKRNERRQFIRRVLLTVALIIVVGVPLAIYIVRRFERAVTFQPAPYDGGPTWRLPARGEDIWFETAGGIKLHGWHVRAETVTPKATVIYLHGNGGNLSYTGWLAEELSARGFDVLLFDYRGYGRSGGVSTGEASLNEDADAAYNYLVNARGVAPETIVLYGQSLGTTAAVDLASRKPCRALILESGLSSASDMAALVVPGVPRFFHRMGLNRFESARKLEAARCPVLVAHGEHDEVIPVAHGRALYDAAREPKRLIIIPRAGHNNVVATGGDEYLDTVAEFIRSSVSGVS